MAENVFRQVSRQAAGGGASSSFGQEERERERRRGIDERTERWNSGASRSLLHDPQFTVTSRRDAVWYLPSGASFSFFPFLNIVTRLPVQNRRIKSLGIVSFVRLPKCELIRLDLDNTGYNIIHRFDEFLASKLREHAPPVTHRSIEFEARSTFSRRINRSERIFIVGGSNSFRRGSETAHAQILGRGTRNHRWSI